jgi:hypothetical protein
MMHPPDRKQRLKLKVKKFKSNEETREIHKVHADKVWHKRLKESLKEQETEHELREFAT